MKGINKKRMSYYNHLIVMRAFYQHEHIGINEIAKEIELSIPTISNIFKDLNKNNYIIQTDKMPSGRGRHRGFWSLNVAREYFFAIEISPFEIKGIIVDAAGNSVSDIQRITKRIIGRDDLLNTTLEIINDLESISVFDVKRCAIAIHGIVDFENGVSIIMPKLIEKSKIYIKEYIENNTKYKVKVDNDCNTKALAEKWIGSGGNIDNFIWINLDYGIGSSIVLSGEVFRGHKYTAGQIGHVSVSSNGPLCSCGSKGCLEVFCSTSSLLSQFKHSWEYSEYTMEKSSDSLTLEDFFFYLNENNPIANQTFSNVSNYLCIAFTYLINIVNPEHIFIGGQLAKMGSRLIDTLADYFRENTIYKDHNYRDITFTELSEEALLSGAAFLWLEEDLILYK